MWAPWLHPRDQFPRLGGSPGSRIFNQHPRCSARLVHLLHPLPSVLDVLLASQHGPGITHKCHLAGSAQCLWEKASAPACGCRRLRPVLRKSRPPDSWPPSILLGLRGGPAFTPIARLHGFPPEKRSTEVETGAPVALGPLPSRFALREGQELSPVLSVESQDSVHFVLHVPACCLPCSGQDSGRTVPGTGSQGPCQGLSACCSSGLFWNFTGSIDHSQSPPIPDHRSGV